MNTVTLVGRTSALLDERTLILDVARVTSSEDANNLKIPLRYWTNDSRNFLMTLGVGKLLVIRGRIDDDEKIGLFVVAEQVSVVK